MCIAACIVHVRVGIPSSFGVAKFGHRPALPGSLDATLVAISSCPWDREWTELAYEYRMPVFDHPGRTSRTKDIVIFFTTKDAGNERFHEE